MALPQLKKIDEVCKRCGSTTSPNDQWWKCCPNHTTEQGPDVICEPCAYLMHPGYSKEGNNAVIRSGN